MNQAKQLGRLREKDLGKPWALSNQSFTSSFGSMDKEDKGTKLWAGLWWGHPSSTGSPPRGLALPYLPANCLMERAKKAPGGWGMCCRGTRAPAWADCTAHRHWDRTTAGLDYPNTSMPSLRGERSSHTTREGNPEVKKKWKQTNHLCKGMLVCFLPHWRTVNPLLPQCTLWQKT